MPVITLYKYSLVLTFGAEIAQTLNLVTSSGPQQRSESRSAKNAQRTTNHIHTLGNSHQYTIPPVKLLDLQSWRSTQGANTSGASAVISMLVAAGVFDHCWNETGSLACKFDT